LELHPIYFSGNVCAVPNIRYSRFLAQLAGLRMLTPPNPSDPARGFILKKDFVSRDPPGKKPHLFAGW
jgi:hypothetical protein